MTSIISRLRQAFTTAEHPTCCICYQEIKPGIKCKFCVEGNICVKCVPCLCENGLADTCPVCRQEDWIEGVISPNSIVPITKSKPPVERQPEEVEVVYNWTPRMAEYCIPLKNMIDVISLCVSGLVVAYAVGVLTLLMVNATSPINDPRWFWIPLLLGIFELRLMSCCCWRCIVNNDQ